MGRTPFLQLALLLGAALLGHQVVADQAEFDFMYFVRQWSGSFCSTHTCRNLHSHGFHMNIHGLWPNYNDGKWPEFCDRSYPFSESKVQDLEDALDEEWPSLMGSNAEFWQHEWEKHGTCALRILPSEHDFFQAVLKLHWKYDLAAALQAANIVPSRSASYSGREVQGAIRDMYGVDVLLHCSPNGDLQEVWMCIDKDLKPFDCSRVGEEQANTDSCRSIIIPPLPGREDEALALLPLDPPDQDNAEEDADYEKKRELTKAKVLGMADGGDASQAEAEHGTDHGRRDDHPHRPDDHDHDGPHRPDDHDHDGPHRPDDHDHDGPHRPDDHDHDGPHRPDDHDHDGPHRPDDHDHDGPDDDDDHHHDHDHVHDHDDRDDHHHDDHHHDDDHHHHRHHDHDHDDRRDHDHDDEHDRGHGRWEEDSREGEPHHHGDEDDDNYDDDDDDRPMGPQGLDEWDEERPDRDGDGDGDDEGLPSPMVLAGKRPCRFLTPCPMLVVAAAAVLLLCVAGVAAARRRRRLQQQQGPGLILAAGDVEKGVKSGVGQKQVYHIRMLTPEELQPLLQQQQKKDVSVKNPLA